MVELNADWLIYTIGILSQLVRGNSDRVQSHRLIWSSDLTRNHEFFLAASVTSTLIRQTLNFESSTKVEPPLSDHPREMEGSRLIVCRAWCFHHRVNLRTYITGRLVKSNRLIGGPFIELPLYNTKWNVKLTNNHPNCEPHPRQIR